MKPTVLCVHPLDEERSRCASALASAGFRVVEARTGEEALNLLVAERPHVTILSSSLPDMDARALCCRIDAAARTAATKVLLVLPVAVDSDLRALLLTTADGYLVEPVDADELVVQVRTLVRLVDAEAETKERKRAEAALRETETRYRRLFDHLAEGFFLAEVISDESGRVVDYRYIDANPALEALTGLKRAAIIGRTLREILPGVEDEWIETFGRVALTGEPARLEAFATPLGRYYTTVAYSPAPGQFACLFSDVTERKRTEEALYDSERIVQRERAFFRAVIDSVSSLITVKDADGRILLANEAAARFHGMSVAELEGRRDAELSTTTADLRQQDADVIRTGKETVAELDMVGADGQHHSFITVKSPMISPEGRHAVLETAADVTWRRRADVALRESERRYAAIFQSAPFAIALTRMPDRRIVSVNDAFLILFECARDEVIGKTAVDLGIADPDSQAHVAAELQQRGSVRHFEVSRATKSGARRTISINIDPVTIGGTTFVVTTVDDITERKRAEVALREADRRKDEFIAVLSHELRNPLAPIQYALPLLQRERLSDPGARAVNVIDRQLRHLTRLVDDLLDVSRITRDKIELRREAVTLDSIVTAAVEAASPAIAAAHHTVTMAVADDPVWLDADPARLTQVVTNLLNNSAKYTPRGGQIRLEAGREGNDAVVRVRDSGIGIPPEALPTVFEMFQQVNRPDDSHGGLGIGLALVKRLVEMHGGTIEAHSTGAGQGAEFVVRLPIAEETTVNVVAQGMATRAAGRRLKVLVVDDNADLVEMLAMVVAGQGHDVRKALDGRSAVSAALSYRPDVVLLDLGLPVMSGTEVARELRRHQETAGARLIAVTGWGQAEDRKQTTEAGFDYHLTKPTDPDTLERLLTDCSTGPQDRSRNGR